jgi:hypothetical protein
VTSSAIGLSPQRRRVLPASEWGSAPDAHHAGMSSSRTSGTGRLPHAVRDDHAALRIDERRATADRPEAGQQGMLESAHEHVRADHPGEDRLWRTGTVKVSVYSSVHR